MTAPYNSSRLPEGRTKTTMKFSHLIPALALSILVPLAGCDKAPDPAQKQACEDFAKHLATVVQTAQGEQVPEEQVTKMVEETVGKCLESPPKEDEMKCAMAAKDLAAMKACDPKQDEKAEKAEKAE